MLWVINEHRKLVTYLKGTCRYFRNTPSSLKTKTTRFRLQNIPLLTHINIMNCNRMITYYSSGLASASVVTMRPQDHFFRQQHFSLLLLFFIFTNYSHNLPLCGSTHLFFSSSLWEVLEQKLENFTILSFQLSKQRQLVWNKWVWNIPDLNCESKVATVARIYTPAPKIFHHHHHQHHHKQHKQQHNSSVNVGYLPVSLRFFRLWPFRNTSEIHFAGHCRCITVFGLCAKNQTKQNTVNVTNSWYNKNRMFWKICLEVTRIVLLLTCLTSL